MAYNKDSPAIAEFRAAIVADWNRSGEPYDKVGRRFGLAPSMVRYHLDTARANGDYVRPSPFNKGNLRRHHSSSNT